MSWKLNRLHKPFKIWVQVFAARVVTTVTKSISSFLLLRSFFSKWRSQSQPLRKLFSLRVCFDPNTISFKTLIPRALFITALFRLSSAWVHQKGRLMSLGPLFVCWRISVNYRKRLPRNFRFRKLQRAWLEISRLTSHLRIAHFLITARLNDRSSRLALKNWRACNEDKIAKLVFNRLSGTLRSF